MKNGIEKAYRKTAKDGMKRFRGGARGLGIPVCLVLCCLSWGIFSGCDDDGILVNVDNAGNRDDASNGDADDDGKTDVTCTDDCAAEGASKCDSVGEWTCGYFDDDPCLDWSEPLPCAAGCAGNHCACVSECDKADEFRCDGKVGYMFCQDDDMDGCLRWSMTTFCGADEECDPVRGGCRPKGYCGAACDVGARECVEEGWRECLADANGCGEWSAVRPCGNEKCVDGSCGGGTPSCWNACQAGARECAEEGWRECKDTNGDGCTEWTPSTACPSPLVCRDGGCVEAPPTCTDVCVSGTRECVEEGWRECKDTNGDGCMEWTSATACDSGQKCESGQCVAACVNACSKGAKQCKGSSLQTCSDFNGDGCTEWGGDSVCEFGCKDSACLPNPNSWVPACSGANCPTVITNFKSVISGNTKNGSNIISRYSGKCTSTDESGPEQRYIFKVDEPGTVIVGTTEPSGGDVDVHLLKSLSASGCLARGDKGLSYHVDKGIYYVVVDTYQSADNAGAYKLKVTFLPDSGKCGLETGVMARSNTPSELAMPATGKVVQEAHLVTDHDQAVHGSGWWPSTKTEGLAEHKAYSAKWTGVTYGSDWCPSGEGGCQFGQGATGKAVPWKAEAYYVCMYWKGSSKPKPGTRFLVVNPQTGKAVVAAAGYETGPGDGSKIGGAVYEIHRKLGTSHNGTLTFGQMRSQGQSLEYGPIDCE